MENLLFATFDYKDNPTNCGARWKKWIDRFDNYLVAVNVVDSARKKALLLHYIGEDVYEIFQNLPELSEDDKHINTTNDEGENQRTLLNAYELAKKMLSLHFEPRINTEFEVFNFRKANQRPNETVNQFYARLLKLSEFCDFTDRDKEIKSQIISTTTSNRLRDYAFQKRPTLQQLLNEAKAFELAAEHVSKMQQHPVDISETNFVKRTKTKKQSKTTLNSTTEKQNTQKQHHYRQNNQQSKKCKFCGYDWHTNGIKSCPAQNQTCNKCGKMNHFGKMCLSNKQTQRANPSNQTKQTNNVESQADDSGEFVFNIKGENKQLPEVVVILNELPVTFTIDSGSTSNIISKYVYNQLNKPSLVETDVQIQTYSRNILPVIGKFEGRFHYKNATVHEDIFVIDNNNINTRSLMSYCTATKLKLLQITCTTVSAEQYKDNVKKKHPSLFGRIGKMLNKEIHLHIDENVPPVVQHCRRIPFHLRAKLEEELKRLETSGIIEKVNGPSPWVSPIVLVPKPNDPNILRVCVDMRAANKAIKRVRHSTPTLQDIIVLLNGATVFSKIDLNDGYHQLALDEQSRVITAFNTHCGIYRYTRLNFGINTAAEVFQDEIRQTLTNIENVINLSDDILVFGKSQTDHDATLSKVLQRLEQNNLTVNERKCLFNQKEIKFFGYIFSSKGLKPDPAKVLAFQQLTIPKTVSEVRSLLGMVNFAIPFLPELSKHTEPLRALIHKNTEFIWTTRHTAALKVLKRLMSNADNLAYYKLGKKTHVHTDAGPTGISAILSQSENNKRDIVSYASRSLTPTEQRYSQIEKEMLAISWAIEHFHIYLFGTKFCLHTDHKPLVSIFRNTLSKNTARIERLLLRIQQYDFDVFHQNGASNPADYFSRHPVEQPKNTNRDDVEQYVNFILNNAIPKAISIDKIKSETLKDNFLQLFKTAIESGDWSKLKQYETVKSEFSLVNGCILKSSRVVIPETLINKTIELAHTGHLGIVKTKQLLRTKVWFQNIDKTTEKYVKSCPTCQVTTDTYNRDPIQLTISTTRPLQQVSADFKGPLPNGKYLFILIDDYSRFPFVDIVSSTSFACIKTSLVKFIVTFGIPEIFKSDNGPPFNGIEFKNFSETFNFKHHLITPLWPEANGQVERSVKTFKKLLMSSLLESKDCFAQLDMFLMNYRSTPHSSTGVSPYELLFNRKMNNMLPSIRDYDQPGTSKKDALRELNVKIKNKEYADSRRHVKSHKFTIGDEVLCKQKKINTLTPPFNPIPYTITQINGSKITAQNGEKQIIRNSSFFKKFLRREGNIDRDKFPGSKQTTNDSHNWSSVYNDYDTTRNSAAVSNNDDHQVETESTLSSLPYYESDFYGFDSPLPFVDDVQTIHHEDQLLANENLQQPDPEQRISRSTRGILPRKYNDFNMD